MAGPVQLAACYRVFDMLGWTEMIYNHITIRLPESVSGGEKQFLINPFGLHYSEVTASNLLKIDLEGNKLDDNPWPVNPAGFTVHSAIHESIADAHCVMHTHTTAGLAVACTQGGLAQNNFYSAQLHGLVAYHDFEGITIHADEAPRLLRNIGDKPAVILRNHGLLAGARRCRWPSCGCGPCSAPAKCRPRRPRWARPIPVPEAVAQQNRGPTRSSGISVSAQARTCSTRWCGESIGSTRATRHERPPPCPAGPGIHAAWIAGQTRNDDPMNMSTPCYRVMPGLTRHPRPAMTTL